MWYQRLIMYVMLQICFIFYYYLKHVPCIPVFPNYCIQSQWGSGHCECTYSIPDSTQQQINSRFTHRGRIKRWGEGEADRQMDRWERKKNSIDSSSVQKQTLYFDLFSHRALDNLSIAYHYNKCNALGFLLKQNKNMLISDIFGWFSTNLNP